MLYPLDFCLKIFIMKELKDLLGLISRILCIYFTFMRI